MPRTASFSLHQEAPRPDIRVIAVEGDADMSAAVRFNESFMRAARIGARKVVADLTFVDYVDSSMLNALVVGHRWMMRDGGSFVLVSRDSGLRRILELTGLEEIFEVFETRAEALDSLR